MKAEIYMVYSLHRELFNMHKENENNFEAAWRSQFAREKISDPNIREPALLQYVKIGKYSVQIERYLTIFTKS